MTGTIDWENAVISAADNLHAIEAGIAKAAQAAGRAAADVRLIAVSKTFAAEAILPVIAAGQRHFGENRVQEAKAKWPPLRREHSKVVLHLIGPLQSNKTREAVELFDAIHSIDRPKIAEAVAAEMTRQGKALELYVQVNTGEEPQKAGIAPREVVAFVAHCRDRLSLAIAGLMCIPPVDEEPAVHFAFLAKLAREAGLARLSMGMSDDYDTAIAFGATDVRIGSAIFGGRGTVEP